MRGDTENRMDAKGNKEFDPIPIDEDKSYSEIFANSDPICVFDHVPSSIMNRFCDNLNKATKGKIRFYFRYYAGRFCLWHTGNWEEAKKVYLDNVSWLNDEINVGNSPRGKKYRSLIRTYGEHNIQKK